MKALPYAQRRLCACRKRRIMHAEDDCCHQCRHDREVGGFRRGRSPSAGHPIEFSQSPEHQARIALYTLRASQSLPLFEE